MKPETYLTNSMLSKLFKCILQASSSERVSRGPLPNVFTGNLTIYRITLKLLELATPRASSGRR